jgi:hypothetical protein
VEAEKVYKSRTLVNLFMSFLRTGAIIMERTLPVVSVTSDSECAGSRRHIFPPLEDPTAVKRAKTPSSLAHELQGLRIGDDGEGHIPPVSTAVLYGSF